MVKAVTENESEENDILKMKIRENRGISSFLGTKMHLVKIGHN